MKVILNNPNSKVPHKAHSSDAGYDLTSVEEVIILPNKSKLVNTGICVALPESYYGKIFSRSGLAVKHNIEVGAGVIDQGYTGEIKVLLRNFGDLAYKINVGDKIAQLVIHRYLSPDVEIVSEINETDRGANGFGSSG